MKNRVKKFFEANQEAIGVIEIILILVVIIALVFLFKNQIEKIVKIALEAITGKSGEIIGKEIT